MQNSLESTFIPLKLIAPISYSEQANLEQQENAKLNLLELNQEDLCELFIRWGEKPIWALQVFKWIHQQGIDDFSKVPSLNKSLQKRLFEECVIQAPEITVEEASIDGTRKWMMRLADGNQIETVFIPERNRGTLCISSQVGCSLNCRFCSTATQGFNRNLTVSEIIGQVWQAARYLKKISSKDSQKLTITNLVLMGMGEPLLNFDAVMTALSIMRSDIAYALPRRRVTLSTSGVVPNMDRLSDMADVSLAVSLHAPNDELRNQLVPLNKKYPLTMLLEACQRYAFAKPNREIIIEYAMLKEVNDTIKHAEELVQILKDLSCKVNLIPFNAFPGTHYQRSSLETIEKFKKVLIKAGFITTIRKTRGEDIAAACGQLVGNIRDRTQRNKRFLAKNLLTEERDTRMKEA